MTRNNTTELTPEECNAIVRKTIEIGNRNPLLPPGNFDRLPLEMKLQIQQGVIGLIKALDELGWTIRRPE